MTSLPAAVLFDWDNTLVNSWPVIHAAMNMTLRDYGKDEWDLEQVQARVRHSMRDAFPALFGERWKEAGEAYRTHYRSMHLDRIAPLPDAEGLLKALRHAGVPMAVVSNKSGDILRKEADALDWTHYFRLLVGSGDLAEDKPSPLPVRHVMEKLHLHEPSHIWFVGDSVVDVDCARAAGCKAVFYGDRFDYDGGTVTLHAQEWHAPDHRFLLEQLPSLTP